MTIHKLAQVNGVICFVVGMVLNSMLVVLICKKRSALSDKGYKPILLQICMLDMLNLILFTFYMPDYTRVGNVSIYYTLGFFNDVFDNAPLLTQSIFRTWFFSISLFVFSPSVQFVYRYLILCRNWKPSYRLYMGLYSLIVFFLLLVAILRTSTAIYVPRASNALYKTYIFTDNPRSADLMLIINPSSNPWPIIITSVIVAIAISIVVVCGIRVWLHFRRHFSVVSDSNKQNQRLQRQVNYVLFIQGGMPIFGYIVPLILTIFLNMETEYTSILPTFLTLVIIVVNPLLTLLLVDSYRRAALNLFLIKFANVNVSTSVVQMSRS